MRDNIFTSHYSVLVINVLYTVPTSYPAKRQHCIDSEWEENVCLYVWSTAFESTNDIKCH